MGKAIIVPLEVRFRDIDAMGHVNNAVYFTYFEEARKAFVLEVFGIQDPKDYFFILASIRCNFFLPIKLKDTIEAIIYVGEIGNKSFTFKYKIRKNTDPNVVFSEGESIQVFYDYKEGKAKPIPEDIKNILKSYIIDQG